MYAEERQQAMARAVAARGRMSVAELASEYDVTTETVRRDLSALEALGLVRRVHGGAVPATALTALEFGLSERNAARVAAKEAIARAALDLLPPTGGSLIIDAGSTTVRLAEMLPRDRRLVVYTHSVPVAARLAVNPAVELHLLPGSVRSATQAAVGPETVAALAQVRVDLAFVGTNGITLDHGFSTPDSTEAATKRAIVGAARRVVVLADATKIGVEATVRFAGIDEVDVLLTDDDVESRQRKELVAGGVEVVVA
ncbi:DeoR/GlpR transcriptional regulator [Nocardioides immobilis]|uniref:Lactose phosphotransferase system repressor n=1 Tax=Nocardioides immobilis TaxID=2049295 RepID=A0A417Y2E7_9ACTN|nr:DeoR/GlpR family DNA-binding transcription regulator [Nocardioides immobilis]RHW26829.1 DeoR/GlpR transcriptional regulator [Nocardioides immobilis]